MSNKTVLVVAHTKAMSKMGAEKYADEQGYRFTSEPPYFCDLRQAWVHELEKPDDLYIADLILDWWSQAEFWKSDDGKSMLDNEPDFVAEAKSIKEKYKTFTI